MDFKDWGEENFIEYLKETFPGKGSLLGIGDDCAVIPGEDGNAWIVTTDAMVEGVHFIKDQIPPKDLGYKTVAVNVSDIAAMGGEPKYAFLSISLPKTIDSTWVCELMQGVRDACEKWNLLLLGGDTVGSKRDVFLSMTILGKAVVSMIKYRSQAKPGDVICVSGYLGDSGGGLKAIQDNIAKTEDIEYLIHAHFHPKPHLKQGIWLASQNGVHAMMDISDGLDCDLKRIIKSSKIGAIVDISRIPVSPILARVSLENQWDSLELALTGGEDYCLLFTVSEDTIDSLQDSFQNAFGIPIYNIGRISNDPQEELSYHKNGEVVQINYKNFDHFQ